MRIQHNIASMNAYRNFGTNNSKLAKNLEKLSSGYAVNRAGDDAAGLAVSEKMRAQITGLEAAQKNAKDGIGLVQTAEGALTEVHDMLNRMVYLAEQSANGTYTASDRQKLQSEVDQLRAEITRIGENANFNGVKLLDGSLNKQLQIGAEKGETLEVAVTLALFNKGGNDIDGNPVTHPTAKKDADGNDIAINTEQWTGISAVDISTSTNAMDSISEIKDAINTISKFRSDLGALQNRLEHTVNNLGVMRENIQDAESRIRDTDMAEEMMKYTKNNIMNQAAQAMLASANQQPQQVLQLLQ